MKFLFIFVLWTFTFTTLAKESMEALVITAANKHEDVSPELLAAFGHIETGWRNVRSKKSSAAGIYQFTTSTWKATLKEAPKSLGVSKRASRFDVRANTEIAAFHTQQNADFLREKLRRDPTPGELYLTHLLGQSGGLSIIKAPRWKRAADVVPDAVAGNKPLFLDSKGRWLTAGQFRKTLSVKVVTLMRAYGPRIDKVTKEMYERELDRQKPWRHWLTADIEDPQPIAIEAQPIELGQCHAHSGWASVPTYCTPWNELFEAFAIRRRHPMILS